MMIVAIIGLSGAANGDRITQLSYISISIFTSVVVYFSCLLLLGEIKKKELSRAE
jgi:hypothetical protein